MGGRSGVGINPDGSFRYINGTSERMQKTFDKVYQKQLKNTGSAAFAKRIAIEAVNNTYGTKFKLPYIAAKETVLSSTNIKGKGVSIMMPW